jgi:putative ABC transport system permease protein
MNVWSMAWRNVARNRRRSLLTGGVVVFGFASFALAGGFMAQSLEGLRDGTIRSGTGHIQIADPAAFAPGADGSLEHPLRQAADVETLLRSDFDVAEVLPRLEFSGLLTNGSRSVPFLGVGLDPAPEARTMDHPKTLVEGRWLRDRNERAVILGTGLASSLGLKVGDTATILATTRDGTLNAVDATVAGLADLPIKELDDRYLATTLGLASDLLVAGGSVTKMVVVLNDTGRTAQALRRIRENLRVRSIPAAAKGWEELAPFYRQVRLLYAGIFGFMGIILVVVVLLAAANTMLMAAAERTREIGTLRALGTRAAFIRRLFLAEGIVLAAVGCVAGALFSLLLRVALNHSGIMLPPPPGATHGMPLHVRFYAMAYGAGGVAMLATLALASWIPARRASRMPIIEALAHV